MPLKRNVGAPHHDRGAVIASHGVESNAYVLWHRSTLAPTARFAVRRPGARSRRGTIARWIVTEQWLAAGSQHTEWLSLFPPTCTVRPSPPVRDSAGYTREPAVGPPGQTACLQGTDGKAVTRQSFPFRSFANAANGLVAAPSSAGGANSAPGLRG